MLAFDATRREWRDTLTLASAPGMLVWHWRGRVEPGVRAVTGFMQTAVPGVAPAWIEIAPLGPA